MSNQVAKNVPNFIPMGQAGGERVRQDDPVELDGEGKPINPHIPKFIAKAPWYLDSGAKSSLKHQRLNDGNGSAPLKNDWYQRDRRAGPAATKYRKGACENCGAASHKTKDCLDRPRKVGAKWTGRDIQADELVQEIATTWDSKRDRANGYDFDHHAATLQAKYDRLESLRAEKGIVEAPALVDELNPVPVSEQTKSSSNTHMRIREDTASYLLKDRDGDSYDPKTRTTRTATPSAGDSIDKADFTRGSNDAQQFEKLQAFAWAEKKQSSAAQNDKVELHAQAMPSQAALQFKASQRAKTAAQEEILKRYGNATQTLPRHLIETIDQESSATDAIKESTGISKYPENVYEHGHNSVWGSWYDKETSQWGYRCCKGMNRDADCSVE